LSSQPAAIEPERLLGEDEAQSQRAAPSINDKPPSDDGTYPAGQECPEADTKDLRHGEEEEEGKENEEADTTKSSEQRALEAAIRDAVARTMMQIAQFRELLKTTHNGPHDDAVEQLIADTKLVSEAQVLRLAPPSNWPINLSTFTRRASTMRFDMDMYQSRASYRWLITERTLGMTKTTTQREYDAEVEGRLQNRRRVLGFANPELPNNRSHESMVKWRACLLYTRRLNAHFQANNAKVTPHTSGWSLNPGEYGVELTEFPVNAIPRLPEMEPAIAGPPIPGGTWEVEGRRYPQSRRWSTMEELVRFPLGLARVQPSEFFHTTRPEVRFIDRLGVTMNGVEQTTQCTRHSEHPVYKRSFAEWYGYDHDWACHGVTYEDYRRLIAGSLAILEENGRNFVRAREELKVFFYEATENLRLRGVPIVVKFKAPINSFRPDMWQNYQISVTHLPLEQKMRRKVGRGRPMSLPVPQAAVPMPVIAPPGPMPRLQVEVDKVQEISSDFEALVLAYRPISQTELEARINAAYQVLMNKKIERGLGMTQSEEDPDPENHIMQGLRTIQEVGLEGLAHERLPVGMERKICVMLANLHPDAEMQEILNPCAFLLD
jgi:hypothetical protein